MTSCSVFSSIDDIDFDGLFDGSLPEMDRGTYPWPSWIETEAEKRSFIRSHVETILAMDNAFAYRVEWEGRDGAAVFGTRQMDGTFLAAIGLVRADLAGSRAWIWDPTVLADREALITGAGFIRYLGDMPKTSPLRTSSFVERHGIDEDSYQPSPMPPFEQALATDIVDMGFGVPEIEQ